MLYFKWRVGCLTMYWICSSRMATVPTMNAYWADHLWCLGDDQFFFVFEVFSVFRFSAFISCCFYYVSFVTMYVVLSDNWRQGFSTLSRWNRLLYVVSKTSSTLVNQSWSCSLSLNIIQSTPSLIRGNSDPFKMRLTDSYIFLGWKVWHKANPIFELYFFRVSTHHSSLWHISSRQADCWTGARQSTQRCGWARATLCWFWVFFLSYFHMYFVLSYAFPNEITCKDVQIGTTGGTLGNWRFERDANHLAEINSPGLESWDRTQVNKDSPIRQRTHRFLLQVNVRL